MPVALMVQLLLGRVHGQVPRWRSSDSPERQGEGDEHHPSDRCPEPLVSGAGRGSDRRGSGRAGQVDVDGQTHLIVADGPFAAAADLLALGWGIQYLDRGGRFTVAPGPDGKLPGSPGSPKGPATPKPPTRSKFVCRECRRGRVHGQVHRWRSSDSPERQGEGDEHHPSDPQLTARQVRAIRDQRRDGNTITAIALASRPTPRFWDNETRCWRAARSAAAPATSAPSPGGIVASNTSSQIRTRQPPNPGGGLGPVDRRGCDLRRSPRALSTDLLDSAPSASPPRPAPTR